MLVHMPAAAACLRRREECTDLHDRGPELLGSAFHYLHEFRECKVADLAPPVLMHLHRLYIQVLDAYRVIPLAELPGKLVEPVLTLVRYLQMKPRQFLKGFLISLGPLLARFPSMSSGEFPVELPYLVQIFSVP